MGDQNKNEVVAATIVATKKIKNPDKFYVSHEKLEEFTFSFICFLFVLP